MVCRNWFKDLVDPHHLVCTFCDVGQQTCPHAGQHRSAHQGGLPNPRYCYRNTKYICLDPIPIFTERLPSADAYLIDSRPRLDQFCCHVPEGIGYRFQDRPCQVFLPVVQRQPEEYPTRLGIPDRRSLSRQVWEKDQPVGANGRLDRLLDQLLVGHLRARHRFPHPVQALAQSRHRAAHNILAGVDPGRRKDARPTDGLVPAQCQPPRRAIHVRRPSRFHQPGPDKGRDAVVHPGNHRQTLRQARLSGSGCRQPGDGVARSHHLRKQLVRQP